MGTITLANIGKAYKQYPSRWSRLGEWILPNQPPRHNLNWILKDISLAIGSGQAVGIVGSNGAGKSTLLKVITGTTQATTGVVQVTGRVAALLELGMGFHPDFTGRQNVNMAGQLLGYSVEDINDRMSEIEAFADVGDYIDEPVRIYSSGMQMRLAFSVATAIRPDILIIDEALAVGDIYFQQKCFERIKAYRAAGSTLLFVSHSMEAVYSLCDRAVLLEGGRIALDGTPKAVIDLYNARLVQRTNVSAGSVRVVESVTPAEVRAEPGGSEVPPLDETTDSVSRVGDSEAGKVGSYFTEGVSIEAVTLWESDRQVESIISEAQTTVRVRVLFQRDFSDPHVGFQIRTSRGDVVFMTNTSAMRHQIGPVKAGDMIEVDFSFVASLAEGQYTVTAGVARDPAPDGHFAESLTRVQEVAAFNVLRNFELIRWAGVCNLHPTCVVRRGALAAGERLAGQGQ